MSDKQPVSQIKASQVQLDQHVQLGSCKSSEWLRDPKHLLFSMARYKFVAKLLSGCQHVLEVGCGDGTLAPIVLQSVAQLTGVDTEAGLIEDGQRLLQGYSQLSLLTHDMLAATLPQQFDAAYSLDVLEHIPVQHEHQFLQNIVASLQASSKFIIGMPSLESQAYASAPSRMGHVNCKSGEDFKALMQQYFEHVFLFSMNDEVVHTGFAPMAHYVICVCCQVKTTQ